jgi:hypothetical protein
LLPLVAELLLRARFPTMAIELLELVELLELL